MSNQAQALNDLFTPQEGPQIINVDNADDSVRISLHVTDQLSWFDGHFPDQKVLPGVVQVDWAGKLARALFVHDDAFQQLSNVKFKTMVMPDTSMQLELSYNTAKNSIKFHYFNDSDSFSMGSFKFVKP
ncbi:ApeI family dehydratase [Alteromonas gilva]|uniref:ApeI dehydratase-like domain-containing protein n=1 Tax=Alteromonas gilva TaxID=2987522 RepID=A0ABT5L0X3_9ALTE|nr:hypothetical protein [Alteromonas gilva]MDC8829463.1 hypothetical protein [Alteromonas gilva]